MNAKENKNSRADGFRVTQVMMWVIAIMMWGAATSFLIVGQGVLNYVVSGAMMLFSSVFLSLIPEIDATYRSMDASDKANREDRMRLIEEHLRWANDSLGVRTNPE